MNGLVQKHLIVAGIIGFMIGAGIALASWEQPINPSTTGLISIITPAIATAILYYTYIYIGGIKPGIKTFIEAYIATLLMTLTASTLIYDLLQ